MIRSSNASSTPRLTTAVAVGLALSAVLAFGSFTTSASAEDRDRDRGHDDRGRGDRDHGWTGGYYAAPPVVYGAPAYSPPVVYGPSVGISVPGVSIGIR